jgi:hypothetical protein
LETLEKPDQDVNRRKYQNNDWNTNGEIEDTLESAVERAVERFIAKADELKAGIFEDGGFVTEELFKVA